MMLRCKFLRLLVTLLLLCGLRGTAAATEVVLLTAVEEESSAVAALESQLAAALRAQLRELDVQLVVVPGSRSALFLNARRAREVAATNQATCVTWIASAGDAIEIFLYDPRGNHLYARRVPSSRSSTASSEEIALVLRSAIAAVVEGNDAVSMIEVALPAPSSPAAQRTVPLPPAPTQAAASPAEVRLAGGYLGTLFSRSAAWQHGVAAAASLHATEAPWFLGLSYAYFPSLRVQGLGVETQIDRHPGELFAGAELRWHQLWITAEGALSADRVSRRTVSAAEGLSAAADSARWLWAMSTRLGGAVNLSPRVRCSLKLGAEFLLQPYNQVITAAGSADQIVAAPLRARPRLELSISARL